MQADFWQKRWERDQIGFHLAEVNPYLQQYWPALGLAAQTRVLVPLCGKSLDLIWLADQGFEVLGIELAEKAVEDFFVSTSCSRRSASTGCSRSTPTVRSSSGAAISLP